MFRAFQIRLGSGRREKPGAFVAVVLVCLAMLALLTVVQIAHVHAVASNADHCPLCMVMHTAAPVAARAAAIVLVQIAVAAAVLNERSVTRLWHLRLYTRPPPTGW